MAYSPLTINIAAKSADSLTATTPAVDTSGVTLLIVCMHYYSLATTPSDNKGNTWTPLTTADSAAFIHGRIYYCANPTVGSGHTFTATSGGGYPAITVLGFTGLNTSPFDVENSGAGASVSTLATGSVSPSKDNELIVAFATTNIQDTTSIDSGFTLVDHGANSGNNVGYASAYLIQTTAASKNPTFTFAASDPDNVALIATFKASGPLFNNYQAVKVGNGMSAGERIR